MKSLLLIRHAKSSWDQSILNDFDRPLNERGKHDAPEMAKRLIRKKINIDLFVASPAKRAKKTATLFVQEFRQRENDIVFIPGLYHASVATFGEVISGIEDKFNSIAVFSHNPGITGFINTLTAIQLDNMPTCGIFGVTVDTDHWSEFSSAEKQFWFFDFPKAGLD